MMKGGKKKMNKLQVCDYFKQKKMLMSYKQKDFENYRASNNPKGARMTADSHANNKQQVLIRIYEK